MPFTRHSELLRIDGCGTWAFAQNVQRGIQNYLAITSGRKKFDQLSPETKDPRKPVEYFGQEAAAFTQRMTAGRRVRLEYDQTNAARGHKDRTPQRRTLAYVFLEDGVLLNAEIVRQGYGHVLTRYPFSRMEEFRRLEREARENRRGLWADDR